MPGNSAVSNLLFRHRPMTRKAKFQMTCDCLPVGFVSMARACERHFPSCWKLKGFKPVARRMFAACTNIRIRSSGHVLCCWMSINLSHQIEIPKKWTALSDPQRQLSWRCSAGMRNAIDTKTNGFTRLRPWKAGGSLLDHIFSMAGFSKLSMWRKSTQPSSPWVDAWKFRSQ